MSFPPPLPLDSGEPRATVAVAIIFPVLATLAVIARFVARNIRSRPGVDDYIIVAALFATYGQMIIIILSVRYGGVGYHLEYLNAKSKEYVVMFYKVIPFLSLPWRDMLTGLCTQLIAMVQFTFGSSLGLVKISLCAMLLRIFTTSRRFTICSMCIFHAKMIYQLEYYTNIG